MFAAIAVAGTSLPPLLVEHGAWQFGGPAALAGTAPLMAWFVALALAMARGPADQRSANPPIARA